MEERMQGARRKKRSLAIEWEIFHTILACDVLLATTLARIWCRRSYADPNLYLGWPTIPEISTLTIIVRQVDHVLIPKVLHVVL
jgi:hypothetical protein